MKKHNEPIPPKALQVLNHISEILEIPIWDMLSKSRKKECINARHIAMHFFCSLEKDNKKPFTQGTIGGWFNCDHTSVIHANAKIKSWLKIYPEFNQTYKRIQEACKHIFVVRLTLAERIDRLPQHEREGIIAYIEKLEKK